MSDYNGREERKEFRLWGMSALGLMVVAVIVLSIVGFGLNSAGIIGKTIVEREVFENSYQRTAGQQQKIATYEAQLAELNRKLSSTTLDDTTRTNLEAQAASIRIQLATAKGTQ